MWLALCALPSSMKPAFLRADGSPASHLVLIANPNGCAGTSACLVKILLHPKIDFMEDDGNGLETCGRAAPDNNKP